MNANASPEFRADPRAWAQRWIDALLRPEIKITKVQRAYLVGRREHLATYETVRPGGALYNKVCRIARECGLMRQRAKQRKLKEIRQAEARAVHVPARHALGAPIPPPPPLRRPVAQADPPETWDPAGMPCR
jgi:hypothetical protein